MIAKRGLSRRATTHLGVCAWSELDPKYVDVIVQRWQTLSGKKATLDGDWRSFDELKTARARQ